MIATRDRRAGTIILGTLLSAYAWGAGAVFVGSLSYFVYFYEVMLSVPADVKVRLYAWGIGGADGTVWAALMVNTALYAAFAAHHSAMARASAKRWLARLLPAALERATYVWVASLLFFALCHLWWSLPGGLYRFEGLAAWPFRAVQIAGVVFALSSARTIDVFDLSGIRQVRQPPTHDHPAAHEMGRLETGGPYRIVRHPIYLGTLALLAGSPEMNADRLLFTALSLVYLLIGIWLEERSLREEFGAAYAEYQRAVKWRILPGVY